MPKESGDVPENLIAVGDSIRNVRDALGMTQQELADASGVGRTTVNNLENYNGTGNPTPKTLRKIAEGLRLEDESLLDIFNGAQPVIKKSRPEPARRTEDSLKEILERISALEQHAASIETAVRKLRPDIFFPTDG